MAAKAKQWMIFYREVGYQYYFFNGTQCICVMENKVPWEINDFDEPVGLIILQEINNNKRKRTFQISKKTYLVVTRGVFAED